jgi:hypothetical protein
VSDIQQLLWLIVGSAYLIFLGLNRIANAIKELHHDMKHDIVSRSQKVKLNEDTKPRWE